VTAVLSAVAFVAIALAVPSTRSTEPVSLDPVGTVLSALGVGAIVLGLIEGPEQGWSSPMTVGSVVVGIAAVVGFVLWELRAEQPLLDPRLFRLRGFGTGAAGLFVMFLAMFGFMLVAMQFLQLILGYSPLKSAVALLPQMMLMMPLAAIAAPLSMKVGQKRLSALGLFIGALGMAWFVTLDANSGYPQFLFGMLVLSVGVGLAMTPATTAIVNSLPIAKQGVASAVNDTAREVGGALGVAILGSAFNTAYRGRISSHVVNLTPEVAKGSKEAPAIAFENARNLGGAQGANLRLATQHAFESGLRAAVIISAVLFALGAFYTWWRGPSVDRTPALDTNDADLDLDLELALEGASLGS
jgi:hypothetical protein